MNYIVITAKTQTYLVAYNIKRKEKASTATAIVLQISRKFR